MGQGKGAEIEAKSLPHRDGSGLNTSEFQAHAETPREALLQIKIDIKSVQ